MVRISNSKYLLRIAGLEFPVVDVKAVQTQDFSPNSVKLTLIVTDSTKSGILLDIVARPDDFHTMDFEIHTDEYIWLFEDTYMNKICEHQQHAHYDILELEFIYKKQYVRENKELDLSE